MRLKDLVNPVRWFSFVQAYLVKTLVPMHIVEQIIYRSIMCKDCTEAGACKHCGCKVPALYYSYFLSCSEGKWGPFMNRKNWADYKAVMQIDFKL